MTIWSFNDSDIRMGLFKHQFEGVCSRNVNLPRLPGRCHFWDTALKEGLLDVIKDHDVALQGELIGPSIQDNYEKVESYQFYLYDIWDIRDQRYLSPDERSMWLYLNDPDNVIKHVPIVHPGYRVFKDVKTMADMQKFCTGPSLNDTVMSEGLVFKRADGKRSFKCISNEYLLATGK